MYTVRQKNLDTEVTVAKLSTYTIFFLLPQIRIKKQRLKNSPPPPHSMSLYLLEKQPDEDVKN
jgi:hypothetical protein